MKIKNHPQWLASAVTGLALVLCTGLGHAADLISYTFDSDIHGFADGGHGTVSWNSTAGVGGGGALQVDIDGVTDTEMDPTVDVTFDTAQYATVEFDMMIDSTSGTDANNTYGNLQIALRDSGWSWDSMWYGAVTTAGSYQHYKFVIQRVSGSYKTEAHIQIQLAGSAAYNAPVRAYFDNIQVTPVPNPWLIDAFTASSEADAWQSQTWSAAGGNVLNTAFDAGGGYTPTGCLEADCAFGTSWGQAVFQNNIAFDPSRYTYLEMDVRVDPANSTLMSDGTYGFLEPIVMDSSWAWTACTPSGVTLTADAANNWQHVKVALPALTGANGLVIKLSGNALGPITLLVDNIQAYSPVGRPAIVGLVPGAPNGVRITMDGAGDQWDREALCIPSGNSYLNYTWGGQTPATYSLTVTNFPSPASSPGMEAHIYIANEDTIPAAASWNETYPGADWNASDIGILHVQNGTNGGVVASFQWKTNLPSANATNIIQVNLTNLNSLDGTWAVNFTDDTHGNLVGPDGTVLTNFTLPDGVQANFTAPSASFVQVGIFKNDSDNTGINDNKSAIITHVLITNAVQVLFDDDFANGLTSNYVWRITAPLRTTWIPQNTAFWLQWTTPDSGFTAQSSASMSGGWSDAGITTIYTDGTGTNRFGALIGGNLPAGDAAFFRLMNPSGQ